MQQRARQPKVIPQGVKEFSYVTLIQISLTLFSVERRILQNFPLKNAKQCHQVGKMVIQGLKKVLP
jgi:hypothetical protein